jgi:hypothetical protein
MLARDMGPAMTAKRIGRLTSLFALVALAGCVGGERKPVRSVARAAPAGPLPESAAFRKCAADLRAAGVRFEILPDQERGGGCRIVDAVRLLDIGTPTANLGAMTCPLAATFSAWTRYAVRPAARLHLGSEVVKIETFGTYACRDMRGAGGTISGKLSEHAHANAIDIAAFQLADGRRISVARNWREDGPAARFLQAIHESACKRFRTVLGPDYNAAHRDHFHFDLGGKAGYCR